MAELTSFEKGEIVEWIDEVPPNMKKVVGEGPFPVLIVDILDAVETRGGCPHPHNQLLTVVGKNNRPHTLPGGWFRKRVEAEAKA